MSVKSALLSFSALATVAQAVNHDVRISGLTFVPSTTNAAVGDTVSFHFTNSAHDVVQGSFSSPCSPIQGAFYSGLDVSGKKFVVDITNTDPIYFYCSVPGHCQAGMVGGINTPNSGNTVSAFSSAAGQAGRSTAPDAVAGGQLLDESATVGSGASATSATSTQQTGTTQAISSSASSVLSSASSSAASAISSMSSAASSRASSVSSAATRASSSIASAVSSAATRTPTSAANSLVNGGEYGSGKVVLTAMAAFGAGLVFWAGLI